MSKRGKKTPDLFERPLKAGDYVLCGSSNYTDNPWHWYYGQIIAVRGAALWLARGTQNGDEYLQESTVYAVRAISTDTSELSAIRDQACEAVRELNRAVDAPDPRTDIATAQRLAEADAMELGWLAEAHTKAWSEHRLDDQIRIMARISAIKGPAAPHCPRALRRSYWRRDGFTTW